MKCNNCGNLLEKEVKYCPECGKKVDNRVIDSEKEKNSLNTVSIVLGILALIIGFNFILPSGIFFSIIFSPIGLILSIVGLILAIKGNKIVKNTLGIVLNAVAIFVTIIFTLILSLLLFLSSSLIKTIKDNNFNLEDLIDGIEEKYNIDEFYNRDVLDRY